jgi:uncharacterized iron-regulated membrane protein
MTALVRTLRKLVFWLHFIAGCTAGVVILIMSLTGTILMYERQILELVDGYHIPASAQTPRLGLEALAAKTSGSVPGTALTALALDSDPEAAVVLSFGREATRYANPYTGEVLGEGAVHFRDFFHWITELHRWLALAGESRETGKAVTGAACLVFLFLVLSGLYLWWPRRLTWHFVKRLVAFDRRLTGRARNWNWHNVFGFWACLPLLFIILTGLIMAYPWASNLLYSLTGNPVPPPREGPGGRNRGGKPEVVPLTGLDRAVAAAQSRYPDWQSLMVRLPSSAKAPVSISVTDSHRGRPDRRLQLNFQLTTGELVSEEKFSDHNLGRQLRLWSRWVHTGEAGGFLGQTLAGLAAFSGAVLVWTGLAMSWQRFRRRKVAKS